MSSGVVDRRMERTASFDGLGGLARQTTRSAASAAEAKQRFFCSGRDPKKSVAHREPSGSPQQQVTGGETTIDSLGSPFIPQHESRAQATCSGQQ